MAFPYDAIRDAIDFILHFRIAGNSYQLCRADLQRRLLFFTLEDTEKGKILSNGPVDRLSRWKNDQPTKHGYQRVFENGGVWMRPIKAAGYYLPESLWQVMIGGYPVIKREDGNDLVQNASIIAREKGKAIGAIVDRGIFSCTFEGCLFSNSTFENCVFDACEFHNIDFSKSKFINCSWKDVSFVGAKTNLSNTVWTNNTVDEDSIELTQNIPRAGAKGSGAWVFEPSATGEWKV